MASQSADKLVKRGAKAERAAHALLARLARQKARLIATANQIGRTRSRGSGLSSSFAAGARVGEAIFGRPRTSIRATTGDGTGAFHFKVTPISRSSAFGDLISGRSASTSKTSTPSSPHGDSPRTSSASHQAYIERPEAIETATQGRDPQPNVANLSAGLGHTKSALLMTPGDAGYAAAAASYLDRDGAVESVWSSFGNIGRTLEDRIAFWRAVEQSESRPAKCKITINPALEKAFWDGVTTDPDAPPLLQKMASSSRDAILTESIKERDAAAIHAYYVARRTDGSNEAQSIAFEPGRGGRVQTRIVLELPADMTPEQRLEIAYNFCATEFHHPNIRFHCAIHSPTSANDERNYHMHITFHDRPAERMIDPATGAQAWDFEIVETYKRPNRVVVSRRPYQKEKIREYQEYKWAYKIRRDYAGIVNAVRKKHGMAACYDHRSYRDMGLEVEAVPSLTRREFHDIQHGRANPVAEDKIAKRWLRALHKLADETPHVEPNKATTRRFADLIAAVSKRAPASTVAAKAAHGAYLDSIRRINEARLDKAALRIAVDQEISALVPETASPTPASRQAKAEIEKLHAYLAQPLDVQETLARQSQRLAVERLGEMERQLKIISPGSLSLSGRSLGNLLAASGLTTAFRAIQSANENAAANVAQPASPPRPTPAPPSATARPAASAAPVPPPPARAAAPLPTTPAQPTTPRPLIDPEPWRLTQIARRAAPQAPAVAPARQAPAAGAPPASPPPPMPAQPMPAQPTTPRPLIDPEPWRLTQIERRDAPKAPAVAPARQAPAAGAPPAPSRSASERPTPPPARPATTAAPERPAISTTRTPIAPTARPAPASGHQPEQPRRPDRPAARATPSVQSPADATPVKPTPVKPTAARAPLARQSDQNPSPGRTASERAAPEPSNTPTKARTIATRAPIAATPQPAQSTPPNPIAPSRRVAKPENEGPSITDTTSRKAPSPVTNPENTSSLPQPIKSSSPHAAPLPSSDAEERARKEKERRDKRRAILSNSKRPSGRGGPER